MKKCCVNSLNTILTGVLIITVLKIIVFEYLIYISEKEHTHIQRIADDSSYMHCDYEPSYPDIIPDIPDDMYHSLDTITTADKFTLKPCTEEKTNFVFLKTHKTATDTLAAVFRRFALNRNLSVMLPLGRKYTLGWPHQIQFFMHRWARSDKTFNIVLDHAVFNYSYFASALPEDTVYFTSLRHPVSRLSSALAYNHMDICGKMPKKVDLTKEFLRNMFHYEDVYKSLDNTLYIKYCPCMRDSVTITKNAMAFDLGFPTGYHFDRPDQQQNYTYISNWLHTIHNQMDFVILVEHFNTSMVLLKRIMCWTLKDVLYRPVNLSRRIRHRITEAESYTYLQWSNVDTLLHRLMNHTFWKRINSLGSDFLEEVEVYEQQLHIVWNFCEGMDQTRKDELVIEKTKWESAYMVTRSDCDMMYDKDDLRLKIKEQYSGSKNEVNTDFNRQAFC